MSCLSTGWKCYWDQENHLCLSSKDESKLNLLEVSNSPPICQPDRSLRELMISVSYVSKSLTQYGFCRKKMFSFNNLSPDWLGKSTHAVNHCEVTISVSQLQCAEMLKSAMKSQEVLFFFYRRVTG